VRERGGPQADGGIDLKLVRGTERVIVQCKHWLTRPVPVQSVRELLGVVTAEGRIAVSSSRRAASLGTQWHSRLASRLSS
jgi:hypothetical protein